jgi:redox-sensitive bicupin YhaK (pirin superfamily)
MMQVRRAEERGYADHGWLRTHHTFSFAGYHDPRFMGFRNLRVINEDEVAGGEGFPTHGHRDMEILSYVVEGALEHRDSMGNGSVIRPGDVQLMSAGTGVMHSEYNHEAERDTKFLQIWIVPKERGLRPGYQQKAFPAEERRGRLRLVASPDGADGSLTLHADARVSIGLLEPGEEVEVELVEGGHGWVQVVRGAVKISGASLTAGDGAAFTHTRALVIEATEPAEVLFFDLA